MSARRHDEVGDGAVEVGVDDGRPGVLAPEAAEHAPQLAVVELGEVVQPRDAAGLRVVAAGADSSLVERQQLRLAAEWYCPGNQHRASSGGDHDLCQRLMCKRAITCLITFNFSRSNVATGKRTIEYIVF